MTDATAWLIVYGDRLDHRCVVLDRARAEQTAVHLHGVLVPLVPAPGYEAPKVQDTNVSRT